MLPRDTMWYSREVSSFLVDTMWYSREVSKIKKINY